MAPLARVLPALEPLTTSDTDRVELVNETIVKEVLQDPGELDFGRGSSPSRTLPSGASGALTAHVWRVCVRGQVHARGRVAREGDGSWSAVPHCAAAVRARRAFPGHDQDRARLPAQRPTRPRPMSDSLSRSVWVGHHDGRVTRSNSSSISNQS